MTSPHYVRVARALALVSGLTGASLVSGCTLSHERDPFADAGRGRPDAGRLMDAGPGRPDAGRPDAGRVDAGLADSGVDAALPDAGHPCDHCVCTFGTDAGPVVSCEEVGQWDCCAVIGPLFPPNVPA